jgi:hypothetical protein
VAVSGQVSCPPLGSSYCPLTTVEAESHFEAMTLYYERQGWGTYTTDFPEVDKQTYRERGWE